MYFHHVEEIFRSWRNATFAPLRIKQQIAENIQQFAHLDSGFSNEELEIILETKEFLYAL